ASEANSPWRPSAGSSVKRESGSSALRCWTSEVATSPPPPLRPWGSSGVMSTTMWRLNRETSDTERRITSVVLVIGVALVAALVVRHSRSWGELRMLASVAGVALAARLVAVGVIYAIATRVHAEGTWLNDEASYFLSTEALMPWPWDRALPRGLD